MREKGIVWVVILACVAGLGLTPQQDVIRLEQRINQMEQRLYAMETTLRSVEQQARLGGTTSRDLSQQEVTLLTSQLQSLQLRLADYDCALAKLDERTLSPAMRDARRKAAAVSDPCRSNADAPLRLPDRRP
jgi:hypothetical protein